jgi:hypothetical protein
MIGLASAPFKKRLLALVLGMKLNVMLEAPEQENRRSLLASAGGVVDRVPRGSF